LTGELGEIPLYVAVPDGEGPFPAVLVVSDALGMTANLRNQVDWLASAGYLAAAPDLVSRAPRERCLFATMRQALRGEGSVSDGFEQARGWLAIHPASTGRVAVAGFCFDGGFSLLLAGSGGFESVGSDYWGLTTGTLAMLAKSCPVVGRARSHELRKEPAQIAEVLWAHSIPHDLKAYPNYGYSFMNDGIDDPTPKWALIMGEMIPERGPDIRDRIRSFLDAHMALP
jgi:carboxymethylenebutenolidase